MDTKTEPLLREGASVAESGELKAICDALSVDLEDYYHVEAFAHYIPRSQWPSFPSRVRQNTGRVLELLDRYHCRATFFVLGWVAEREPSLVREVAEAGHEIACHSY